MLLSVVLVTHRHQAWIRPCLQSILASADMAAAGDTGDRGDGLVEVLVVDEASPDHTADIVAQVAGVDDRVRLRRLDTHVGAAQSREAGLAESAGDYIWFLEAADLMLPGAVATVAAAVALRPEVLLVPEVVRDVYSIDRTPPPLAPGEVPMRNVVARRDLALHLGRLASAEATTLGTPLFVHRRLPAKVAAVWGDLAERSPAASAAPPPSLGRRGKRVLRRVARGLPRHPSQVRAKAFQAEYAVERRRPLDPDLAVFTAYWGSAYSCNPRAIFEKARELAPWVRGVWVVAAGSEGVIPAGVPYVVTGSREYYRLMARATYFVNNANFANDIVKRPGQVHVQTHHGTPLKTMGMDLVHARHSSLGLNFRRLMRRIARWDYSISANPFSTEIWERVYPSGTFESLETGYPRNDVLATATAKHRARVRSDLGIGEHQTAVLYTPTHREYTKDYVALFDVEALAKALGPDVVVLMRAHYFYGAGAMPTVGSGVIDVAAHPSIEDLSIASDVLVTDYSSLMFDYAVLDRPIVIYAPDWETYRTERGTYFDLVAEPPGAVAQTEAELIEVLGSGAYSSSVNEALRQVFRSKFASLEDGHASERVVGRIWPPR